MPTVWDSTFFATLLRTLCQLIVDSTIKATFVLIVSIVVCWALRRSSAAIRDYIWTLTFFSLAALPAISMAVPQWQISYVSSESVRSPDSSMDVQNRTSRTRERERIAANSDEILLSPGGLIQRQSKDRLAIGSAELNRGTDLNATNFRSDLKEIQTGQTNSSAAIIASLVSALIRWTVPLCLIWIVGAVLCAIPFTLASYASWTLCRSGTLLCSGSAHATLIAAAKQLNLQRHVTLLQADHQIVPMTCGIVLPVVVIPSNWTSWPLARLRLVMLHELSHIKRGDVLAHTIARLVCSLYWFHPLAWCAYRQMRIDCEMACDDHVISTGELASGYADELIEIARSYRPAAFWLGIAMARTSKLEGRIMSLLDVKQPHVSIGKRATIALSILFAGLVISLSMMSFSDRSAAVLATEKEPRPFAATNQEPAKADRQVAQAARSKPTVTKDQAAGGKLQSVGEFDSPQLGGASQRNNVHGGSNIPTKWDQTTGENIAWVASLGSMTKSTPVVANGKVFIGTNNGHGYAKRYPSNVDLGVLLAFDEKTGDFLWQASSPKLPVGRVHDWPHYGVWSTPYCDDSRLWYVTNRCEVVCLDVEGFRDGVNNGPFQSEQSQNKEDADIIWQFDMIRELGVSPHNFSKSSITCAGDRCFVVTGNGVDESHHILPSPDAPSFLALDRNTGKVLWTDSSPGINILNFQWSSPCVFEAGGREQVLMPGGDGWLYSFDTAGDGSGHAKLLWKFDCNPKESIYQLSGRCDRTNIVAPPTFHDGYVYLGVGDEPERGEGVGHLYCIDPTKDGDVSRELAVDSLGNPIAHRRYQAVDPKRNETAIPNPNSACVWQYDAFDRNRDGKYAFEETMHRTMGMVAIKNDLLIATDFSGLVHCMDTKKIDNGRPVVYWTHDLMAACWSSPLIVDDKIYVSDEDGDICIFKLAREKKQIAEINVGSSVDSTPVVANDILFIASKHKLFALKTGAVLKKELRIPSAN